MKTTIRIANWINGIGMSVRAAYEFDTEKEEFYFRNLDSSQHKLYNTNSVISNPTFQWEDPIVLELISPNE